MHECEALATLRLAYLGPFFLDPEDVSSLNLGQSERLLKEQASHELDVDYGAHKVCRKRPAFIGTERAQPHLKYSKGKSVPLEARNGPEGSRKLRFPDYMTTAQDGGKVVSLTQQPPLPPGNAPGTHFC